MTSFFLGKYSILSNLTLIVGLTSVLNMSSTKADSSNKVCVKAESGEIGCGEVIPSPTSSNNNKKNTNDCSRYTRKFFDNLESQFLW